MSDKMTGMNAVNVRSIKDARRLLSRIITQFQKDEIKGTKAKTLTYLLVQYVHIYEVEKIEELETKLENLENSLR